MDNSEENQPIAPPAYFASLTIENVKCFKNKQTIDLSDGNGKPAMWTVVLGNNNTGKTTLLKCFSNLEASEFFKLTPEKDDVFVYYEPKIKSHNNRQSNYNLQLPIKINSEIFLQDKNSTVLKKWDWNFNISESELNRKLGTLKSTSYSDFENTISKLIIYGYGTNRRAGKNYLSGEDQQDNTETLFDDTAALTNIEEWLLQLHLAKILKKNNSIDAEKILTKIKEIISSGILPDVQDFDVDTTDDFKGFIKFKTDYGWVKLKELGYGYRSVTTLVLDLLKKLFEHYPKSNNPLKEPAIVLIDEIDLHLHPEWQRNIIKYLSDLFPKTQFIVTAHSPLIVQSAENINLVMLEKQGDHVIINQYPKPRSFEGWSLDEILMDLMGLDERVSSDKYLDIMQNFDDALDEDNYEKAKQAYDDLEKILHPASHQRKLLRIQMSSLMPAS